MRLKGWDYRLQGAYFITFCTKHRRHFFGEVEDSKMILSDVGKIASALWAEIPAHTRDCTLGEFVVMPNHVHGILMIEEDWIDYTNYISSPFSLAVRSIPALISGSEMLCSSDRHSFDYLPESLFDNPGTSVAANLFHHADRLTDDLNTNQINREEPDNLGKIANPAQPHDAAHSMKLNKNTENSNYLSPGLNSINIRDSENSEPLSSGDGKEANRARGIDSKSYHSKLSKISEPYWPEHPAYLSSFRMSRISPKANSISTIVRSYKSAVTKYCNRLNYEFEWQPRFYDNIIRDVRSFRNITTYIRNNPSN